MERVKVWAYPWGEGGWTVESPAHGMLANAETITDAMVKLREALTMTHGPCQLDLVMTLGEKRGR